jgi:hypothetical protein
MEEAAGKTSSWVDFTSVPYEDGYEWRKYGEKKINGTSHTRSYFRCTYKDDTGCLATKHVQQQDTSSDPPMFQVTYNNHHTCRSSKGAHAAAAAAAMKNIKQEPPAVLPPLVEAYYYSAPPFDQVQGQTLPPCQQEPFPAGNQRQQQQPWCGIASTSSSATTTTSSCISGESCHQYSDMLQMAAAEASAGDDFLYDLERFLLGDQSFNIY